MAACGSTCVSGLFVDFVRDVFRVSAFGSVRRLHHGSTFEDKYMCNKRSLAKYSNSSNNRVSSTEGCQTRIVSSFVFKAKHEEQQFAPGPPKIGSCGSIGSTRRDVFWQNVQHIVSIRELNEHQI